MKSRMRRYARTSLKWGVIHLAASMVLMTLSLGFHVGHADVPLSLFPAYLVLAPIYPLIMLYDLLNEPTMQMVSWLVLYIFLLMAIWWWQRLLRQIWPSVETHDE